MHHSATGLAAVQCFGLQQTLLYYAIVIVFHSDWAIAWGSLEGNQKLALGQLRGVLQSMQRHHRAGAAGGGA